MKTDLERFIELYKDFGITCEVHEQDGDVDTWLGLKDIQKVQFITFKVGDSLIYGYHLSETTIVFDMSGKFLQQMIWK